MATIADIYKKYTIPPQLQKHQLTVAAVGKVVAEANKADVRTVVTACLLHDMGNIIKFKLDRFPEFLEPEGHDYWAKVQQQFFEKYGRDEQLATLMICDELRVSDTVLSCIRSVGMTQVHQNLAEGTLEEKCTNYADLRVGPRGITSLEERFADGERRNGYTHDGVTVTKEGYATMKKQALTMEQVLSSNTFRASGISEATIKPFIEELRGYILT